MQKHEQYEELCALAATGQLTEEEQRQLNEHMEGCADCRAACEDFSALLRELPGGEEMGGLVSLRQAEEDAYRKRFLARARAEGRRFSPEAEQGRAHNGFRWRIPHMVAVSQWATVAAVILLLIGVFGYAALRKNVRLPSALLRPTPAPIGSAVPRTSDELGARLAELQRASAAFQMEIEVLKTENAALQDRLQAADRSLGSTRTDNKQLTAALALANELNVRLESGALESAQLLAETRSELEKARTYGSETTANLAIKVRTIDELSSQLKAQTASLEREREFLSAGRDIRDLMGARNLHIIDVHDADGKGKNKRSFGRVFYTEGKSLIFYAFDLDEGKIADAKHSFEVWGERLGQPASVKSLGVLYVDDKALKRWALKVDDPLQLAEIDSVFVTLEPKGVRTKPRGQTILYAFLGGRPNHP